MHKIQSTPKTSWTRLLTINETKNKNYTVSHKLTHISLNITYSYIKPPPKTENTKFHSQLQ